MRLQRLTFMAALVLLAGCSTGGIYKAPPVEDRSTVKGALDNNSPVTTPVDPAAEVRVTPVAPTPVFRPQRDTSASQTPSVPVPPAAVVQTRQNPAVVALLNSAKKQTSGGQLRSAQSQLQRALRISPKDPAVYLALADSHRRLGEYLQAEQVALKGVTVAQGQSGHLNKLWKVIASIRTDAGDSEGAAQAASLARRYQ